MVVNGMRGSLAGNMTPQQRVRRGSVMARSRTVRVSAIVMPISPAEAPRAGDEDYSDPSIRRPARIRIDEQWCVPNTFPIVQLSFPGALGGRAPAVMMYCDLHSRRQ
jgi:hypothetical protein